MRVLYFSDNVSEHNRRFLRKLAVSGHDIWFCEFTAQKLPPGWLPAGIQTRSFSVPLPRSSGPQEVRMLLPELKRIIEQVQPDVIHAGPVQTCGYLTTLADFHPMLLTSWGSDILVFSEQDEVWREATRTAVAGADGLLVDSDWVLNSARKFGHIPDERVVQFPWGIEPGLFGPTGPVVNETEFRREPGDFVLICTRAWEPLYGMEILLQGFLSAYHCDSRIRLALVGCGSQENMLREFLSQHRLSAAVTMVGPRSGDQLPAWFRTADTYISCAKSDGTSISLLEAMATGLPVIVTDIPSNREWVLPEINGWVARDAEGFAEAILKAAKLRPEDRSRISDTNRKIVSERANWNQNFPKLLNMYRYLYANPKKLDY